MSSAHEGPTAPLEGLLSALRLALGSASPETEARKLARVADWPAVDALVRRHQVGPLVSLAARGGGTEAATLLAQELPSVARTRTRLVQRGLQQLAGLQWATGCLDRAGVPWLVLKGLPLGARLFGTPLARDCYDIDLLVPPAAAGDAERALVQGGWDLRKPSFRQTPARVRCYNRFVKDRLFTGPGGVLELHHRLTRNPHLLPSDFDRLRANAAKVEIGGRRFAALGDEDLLIYLCVHAHLHRWRCLKWVCDVAALAGSMSGDQFRASVERCRRLNTRLQPALATALTLCRRHLHVKPPAIEGLSPGGAGAMREARHARRLWNRPAADAGLRRGFPRWMEEMRFAGAMAPWRGLAHELARLCIAPYQFDRIDLPDRLFFLYVPLRPILHLLARLDRARSKAPH